MKMYITQPAAAATTTARGLKKKYLQLRVHIAFWHAILIKRALGGWSVFSYSLACSIVLLAFFLFLLRTIKELIVQPSQCDLY